MSALKSNCKYYFGSETRGMERTCNISFLVQYKSLNYFDGILFQICYQFSRGHNIISALKASF